MKKTLTTIILFAGSFFFCQALMAQSYSASKTAPDGKPVLAADKSQASKSSVQSEKPVPPLPPVAPVRKKIETNGTNNSLVSAAPVSPVTDPNFGVQRVDVSESAVAMPLPIAKQNTTVAETAKPLVKGQPQTQTAPVKNN